MVPKTRWYPLRSSPFPKRETKEQAPPQNLPLPPPFLLRPAFPALNMIKTYFDSNFVQHIPQSDFNMGFPWYITYRLGNRKNTSGCRNKKECSMVRKKKKRASSPRKNIALTAKELESSSSPNKISEIYISKMEVKNENKIKQKENINADEEKLKQSITIIKNDIRFEDL
ncbi:hypothetical protein TNCV_922701 [Trichonephila clavipes]|nr:hypothetical protein TNCV_922701 [Trichonephila clavipes]